MKFQTTEDAIVHTISDDMKITDVINVKIRSAESEVCFMFPQYQTRALQGPREGGFEGGCC